jgi:hypothetical protein
VAQRYRTRLRSRLRVAAALLQVKCALQARRDSPR